jgi:hypothetical protein
MTTDRSAKKAARTRMAATGEAYSTARRKVQAGPDHPAPLARPPAIDPREHAVHTRHWGVRVSYLVHYEDRYSVWFTSPDPHDPSEAYPVPSEAAGRAFVDAWLTAELLRTPWDERTPALFLLSPDVRNGILYEAAVVNVEDSGLWLACFDHTANDGGRHSLRRCEGQAEAVEQFAVLAERAADRLENERAISQADLFARVLRYRAATVRADAARAALGDTIRRHQPQGDGWHALWHETGLSEEALGRVLAGQEWTWPQRPVVRPPGSRLPDTPTTTLATHTVHGHRFDLVTYRDTADARCLAVDQDGRPGAWVRDIQVREQDLINPARTMPTGEHGPAAIYGGVHDSVTELYAVMRNGERVDWPIYDDPPNAARYFAVIADAETLADVIVVAPTGSISLRQSLAIWFEPPPGSGITPAP